MRSAQDARQSLSFSLGKRTREVEQSFDSYLPSIQLEAQNYGLEGGRTLHVSGKLKAEEDVRIVRELQKARLLDENRGIAREVLDIKPEVEARLRNAVGFL